MIEEFDTDTMRRREAARTENVAHTLAVDAPSNTVYPFLLETLARPWSSIATDGFLFQEAVVPITPLLVGLSDVAHFATLMVSDAR
jgi:hypothetical protein